MYYSDNQERLRTDAKFDLYEYKTDPGSPTEGHQLKKSPLIGIVPCIKGFSLDYMHLVCLGVVRRLVYFWKKGSKVTRKCKQANSQFLRISEQLSNYSQKTA